MIRRRELIIGAGAAAIAGPAVLRAEEVVTIKMGALKLIHSIAPYFYEKFTPAGYKVEVIPFESPTEGKNAVRHQVGRLRHVRHRRRHPRRRGRRAGRRHRQRLQQAAWR